MGPPLHMVRVAGLDGHGPIELLQEDEAAQFMGQGEAGQGQAFGGGGQGRLVQPQMAADEEGEGAGFQFPLGEPGGEFFRGKLAALGGEGDAEARGGIWAWRRWPSRSLTAAAVRPAASFSSRTLFRVRCSKGWRRF